MSWHYITEAEAQRANQLVTGSSDLLVAPMLLRSAVSRQWMGIDDQELYPTLHGKAGALFHGLIVNHAFADGNKRTAVLCLTVFCDLNGQPLVVTDDQMVDLAVSTAAKTPPVQAVIASVETMLTPGLYLN